VEGRNCYHLVRLVVDDALAADLPVGDEERPADTSRHALSLHLGGGRYRPRARRAWVKSKGAGREAYGGGGVRDGRGVHLLWGAPCSRRVSPLLNLSRSQSIAICH